MAFVGHSEETKRHLSEVHKGRPFAHHAKVIASLARLQARTQGSDDTTYNPGPGIVIPLPVPKPESFASWLHRLAREHAATSTKRRVHNDAS